MYNSLIVACVTVGVTGLLLIAVHYVVSLTWCTILKRDGGEGKAEYSDNVRHEAKRYVNLSSTTLWLGCLLVSLAAVFLLLGALLQ